MSILVIANNPDLQFHYHRMERQIRGIYSNFARLTTPDPIRWIPEKKHSVDSLHISKRRAARSQG